MIKVNIPGVGAANFPDDTPPEVMESAVKDHIARSQVDRMTGLINRAPDKNPPLNEARVSEVQGAIHRATPDNPLWMEKHSLPSPPGKDLMSKVAWPVANIAAGMLPVGRLAKGAIGGGMAIAEDLSKGETPSIGHTAMGVGSALIPEGLVQAGKWGLRTAAKAFGKGPLQAGGRAAAEKVLERVPSTAEAEGGFAATKNITRPAPLDATSNVATKGNEILAKGAKTGLEPSVETAMQKELTDIGARVNSGQPLTYGEAFSRARHMNDMAKTVQTTEGKQAFYKMHDAYMADLAKLGPEAKQAVDTFKLAKRGEEAIAAVGSGNKEALARTVDKARGAFSAKEVEDMQAIARHVGPEWKSTFSTIAHSIGIQGLGATAAPGVIMSALVRMPGGAGVALARSLVSPEGTISKNVAPAIGMAVRSYIAQEQNGNNKVQLNR